jgi:hypothetical protein
MSQRANASWAVAHLLVCALFLAHASWRLHRNLRYLAAQSAGAAWWKRWLRLRPSHLKGLNYASDCGAESLLASAHAKRAKPGSSKRVNRGLKSLASAGFWWEVPPI